jgi:carboxypeptidase T
MHRKLVITIILSVFFTSALIILATLATVRAQEADERALLLISYTAQTELERLAGTLDVWEVRPGEAGGGRVVAYVSADEWAWLRSEGFAFETLPLPEVGVGPDALLDYACYRTIDQLYADLQIAHADHPTITALIDIGESYEGRDIWVLRIANPAIPGPKPTFFLIANVHGRELITNELAMVFIDYLTKNYGVDPDVTWLVDYHEIHVSVSTNPDGHVKNEPPSDYAYWRKNTNDSHGCSTSYGVDLNRNSTFGWDICGNQYNCSSGYPCVQTYRGPSAGSESETQAVEAYARSIFPDQREDALDAAAPLTTTGVFITLHSYSNLVLWPWGHTYDPAPNAVGLAALGRKMASYNGYTPKQASGLYPTDGTTDDWTYGALGIASYTFEIGSSFYPDCAQYDALIQPNIPALLYAAKAARTPYLTAHGPDARTVSTTVGGTLLGAMVRITAEIDDLDNGGDRIVGAEYYVDAPPGAGGIGAPMTAVDGAFDSPVEQVESWAPTAGWTPGRHLVFVRGQDEAGYWGPLSATFLTVYTDVVTTGVIAGRVSGPGGDGLAGAALRFAGAGERAGERFETVTGVDGLYRVTVLSGTYTGTAEALGYYSRAITGVVAAAGVTTTQDFALTVYTDVITTSVIAGRVSGPGGDGLAGAGVRFERAVERAGERFETVTGVDGLYRVTVLSGTYTGTAEALGYYSRAITGVVATAGVTTMQDFTLTERLWLYLPCVIRGL